MDKTFYPMMKKLLVENRLQDADPDTSAGFLALMGHQTPISSVLGIHHAESGLTNHLPSTSEGIDLSLSELENSTSSLLMKSLYVR